MAKPEHKDFPGCIGRMKFRRRYAWWPVQLWTTHKRHVAPTGKWLWRSYVVELNTMHYEKPWVAYERYQCSWPEIEEMLRI